jgi:hypothetical protein
MKYFALAVKLENTKLRPEVLYQITIRKITSGIQQSNKPNVSSTILHWNISAEIVLPAYEPQTVFQSRNDSIAVIVYSYINLERCE